MVQLSIALLTYGEGCTGGVVDDAGGMAAVEARGGDDEFGDVERQETVAIELAGIALRQHKGLADAAVGIDVTKIGTCEEAVVTAGTDDEPAGVGAPVVERFRVVGVGRGHRTALAGSEVEEPEVGLVVPDAELSVVRERVAQEPAVVGGSGEGDGLLL